MKFIGLLCISVTLLSQTSNAQGCSNRTQSYSNKQITKATGTKTQGDAAFADYFINMGATFKF